MPSSSIEHIASVGVRRLILHTASIKPDATAIALVMVGQPLSTDPSVPPPQMIYSLPKTLATSCFVQVGAAGVRDVVVDTGNQLQFETSMSYRTTPELFDICSPTLCPAKVLQIWLVSVSFSATDAKKKHRHQEPCFSCVAYADIPLPLALFTQAGGVAVNSGGQIELPLCVPSDKDRRNPIAVVTLSAEESLHVKHAKRANAALEHSISSTHCAYRARGMHGRRTTAATMAAGVQQRAQKFFEKMKSAFEGATNHSASDEDVTSPTTIGASSLLSIPGPSKSASGLSTKSQPTPTAVALHDPVTPVGGEHRSTFSFTVPANNAGLHSAVAASQSQERGAVKYNNAPPTHQQDAAQECERYRGNVVVFDGVSPFLMHFNSHVGAAAEPVPSGAVLFLCETHDSTPQQQQNDQRHRDTLVRELVSMRWPVPILVLLVKHQDFQEDSGNVCRGLSDVLHVFLTRYKKKELPGVWFMTSDAMASECLAILVAWFRDQPPGVAPSLNPAVGILFAPTPTLQLGFDDLHRASLRLQGERTPPPRSTSVASSLLRLQPLLQSLITANVRLDLQFTFPISCAVLNIVNDGNSETRRIYFSKCLHVLCARGLEVRFDATEEAPSITNSKRRWTNVGRDPVLVGIYRFPCQGHFDYALYPGGSPGALGGSFDENTVRAPPPLRMWTTRKRVGGLTVGSNAIVPDFMCTSLYGQCFSCVEMKPASKRCCLSVFVDSDTPPTFDDDSNSGVPHLPGSGGRGDMKGIVMGVECDSVSISAFDVAHIPLFPCR